jgi:2-keto-3-deoxy-L-rhamnonate aldolase RhmA
MKYPPEGVRGVGAARALSELGPVFVAAGTGIDVLREGLLSALANIERR